MNYDLMIAALCIWREARSESAAAMTGVWHVIQNRAFDDKKRWPRDFADVVLQPYQFSSFNANDPNAVLWPSRAHTQDWAAFQRCILVVSSALNADPTGGSNMYHSYPNAMKTDPVWPKWATDQAFACEIGPFKFYRL